MLHFQAHHASFKVNKNLFRKTINIFFMDLLGQDGPIAPNKFFSEKNIQFTCISWLLAFASVLKSPLSGSIVRTACHFGAQNGAFVTRKNFLQKNHKHNFDLLARFIVRNSKRKSEWVQSYGTCHFGAKNGANTSRKVFFRKTINLFLMYLLNPFTVQNLKKILTADPDL